VRDPTKPSQTPFYVFVSGHIESGLINDSDGICCKYDFIAGIDWAIVEVLTYFMIMNYREIEVEYHSMLINLNKLIEE
jgi:hypothetical protein